MFRGPFVHTPRMDVPPQSQARVSVGVQYPVLAYHVYGVKTSICDVVNAVIDCLAERAGEARTAVTPRSVAARTENIWITLLQRSTIRGGLVWRFIGAYLYSVLRKCCIISNDGSGQKPRVPYDEDGQAVRRAMCTRHGNRSV